MRNAAGDYLFNLGMGWPIGNRRFQAVSKLRLSGLERAVITQKNMQRI